MNILQSILSEIKKSVKCPVCKKSYKYDDLILRGFMDKTFIFEVECSNGHDMFLVATMDIKNSKKKIKYQPISKDEGLKLKNALKAFNGDFKSIT